MRTTEPQNKILNRLYREVEINIHDGNQKKTVRTLAKKGLVEFDVVPMVFGDDVPENMTFLKVRFTDAGLRYAQTQH